MTANSVADTSLHNGRVNFPRSVASGLIGVIQKATQGEADVDKTFKSNRKAALDAGLLFGAYHFGTGANGVSQAKHFLDTVEPDERTVVVLDFEDNTVGTTMPLEEARAFVTHICEKLNRWPGFYSGHTIKRVLGSTVDPVLRNCWFWLAQAGRVGRCGNIPTAMSARRLTTSPASAIATETCSTATTRNCGVGGEPSRRPPPRDE